MTSRRRLVLLAVAGLLAALIAAVAHFPARVAAAWLAPAAVKPWGVEGSVWSGRAAGIVLQGQDLGALSWDAGVLSVLTLRPAWDFSLRRADGFAEGRAQVSLLGGRVALDDFRAALELGTLPRMVVPEGTAGQARVELERLVLRDGWPATVVGWATVNQLELPGVILALGPFEFRFEPQDGPPLGQISSLGGPLAVDGRIELPAPRQWRFSADLAPGEDPPRELVEGLKFVGEDLGDGRRRLELGSEPQ